MNAFGNTVESHIGQPHRQMMKMLQASLVTQLLAVVAELGIPDLVRGEPRTVAELAETTKTDRGALYRVLRALASSGVFREMDSGRFAATALSDTLCAEEPESMRDWARLWGVPERSQAINNVMYTLRTGRPAFDQVHGMNWWSHLAANPEQAAVFNNAMGDLARQIHAAAVSTYDLSGVRRLIDVGGGHGHLVATILRRYPRMAAVVYDQPSVVRDAAPVLAEAGVADRVELVAGDFFESVPPAGDAYLLSMILHDWDDTQSSRILANIRDAMDPAGRVLVIDAVVPEDNSEHDGKLRDIIMLALHPGRERTIPEFAALFEAAALRHSDTAALSGSTSLLVATRADDGQR